jgi:hypothetical protein
VREESASPKGKVYFKTLETAEAYLQNKKWQKEQIERDIN